MSIEDNYQINWANAKAGERIRHKVGDLVVCGDRPNIVARVLERKGKYLVIDCGGGNHRTVHQRDTASLSNVVLVSPTSTALYGPSQTRKSLIAFLRTLRR